MCTAVSMKSIDDAFMLSRTMDFSFPLEPQMILLPRDYELKFAFLDNPIKDHLAFMGLAQDLGQYFMADGLNEKGLSGAALYFEGYAKYEEEIKENQSLAPHEVLMFALAICEDIEEVKSVFENYSVVERQLAFINSVPPLHWFFQDKSGANVIVEIVEEGIKFYENSFGVLTNSPDFAWHQTNIRNYISLHPRQREPIAINSELVKAFGQGSGTFGLPGDLTPPSRMIKTLYNKLSSEKARNSHELLIQSMHILNSVDIVKGSVVTQRDTVDYTQYTSYMDNSNLIYSYRLHDSLNVQKVRMDEYDLDGTSANFI